MPTCTCTRAATPSSSCVPTAPTASKAAKESSRISTAVKDRGAFTLLEVTVVLAVVALAAGLLLPRLVDVDGVRVDAAARRLVDGIAFGRERAIRGGTTLRRVVGREARRWGAGTGWRGTARYES